MQGLSTVFVNREYYSVATNLSDALSKFYNKRIVMFI